jgi:hypothetical protein
MAAKKSSKKLKKSKKLRANKSLTVVAGQPIPAGS